MTKRDTYNTLTDEELVRQIVEQKNSSLYELLFNRYKGKVLDKCYSLLRNRELAEEFTEDILSKAYEKLPGFKGNSSFSSWLYSITYNHCIDYLREKKKLHYPEWNRQNEIPEIADDIDEDMTELHYSRMIKILDIMHTEERAMILMKYKDELSVKEIAGSLRLTEGAVKMRLKRAKARLVYLYNKLYGEY
ncbi:MAG: RNA polymerase sigma factor [Bacteroidales bacterium]|nr:RNA polymerase sigma factor [Bacteroidales bacterium]